MTDEEWQVLKRLVTRAELWQYVLTILEMVKAQYPTYPIEQTAMAALMTRFNGFLEKNGITI